MKKGTIWMAIGLILIASSLLLTGYNIMQDQKAKKMSAAVIDEFQKQGLRDEVVDYNKHPDAEMPVIEINGNKYIGTLQIPTLQLELPILSEWSEKLLQIAPCRYKGSVYSDDIIIAGHNYRSHFGKIKNLIPGDQIVFQDVIGNQFVYQVAVMEELGATQVEEMESGEWDLTLFTCTYGRQARTTIRCELIDSNFLIKDGE